MAITGIYALLNPKKLAPKNAFRYWTTRLVTLMVVWACFSVPFGISLGGAASYILQEYSRTIIFFFLLVLTIKTVRDLYAYVWAYAIGSLILVWMALFVFHLSHASGTYAYRLSNLYSYDANDIGCVFMPGLACALLLFQTTKGKLKLVAGVTLLGIGAAMARSGSRGGFIAIAVVGVALLVMLKTVPVPKRVGFVLATMLALVIAAPPGYWEQMGTILAPKQDYNWSTKDGRKEVWTRGMGYMLEHPIFGLGINNFQKAECFLSQKAQNHIAGTGLRCTPPHSSYVEAGAELGIPGLIMFSGLILGGIVSMLRLRRRMPSSWLRGDPEERFLYHAPMYFAIGMIGFAVACAFLTFAWLDIIYILLAFMTGLYASIDRKLQETGARLAVRQMPRRGLPRAVPAQPPR